MALWLGKGALCLLWCVSLVYAQPATGDDLVVDAFTQPGSSRPSYAPASFDCKARQLAMQFAATIVPDQLRDLLPAVSDALEIDVLCGNVEDTATEGRTEGRFASRHSRTSHEPAMHQDGSNVLNLYVSAASGDDSNEGSMARPLLTIEEALVRHKKIRQNHQYGRATIYLSGRFHVKDVLSIDDGHSFLTLRDWPGEDVPLISGGVPLKVEWNPVGQSQVSSTWSTDLTGQVASVPGLRIDGQRLFRARYPNVNSMTTGDIRIAGGSAAWVAPKDMGTPSYYTSNLTREGTADGEFSKYTIGSGGPCSIFSPPESYWCAEHPEGGGAFQFRVPSGLNLSAAPSLLPNLPYKDASQAVFNVWRPARWANWMFEVDSNKNYDREDSIFYFERGGFQGARGNDNGGDFFVENVMEELDYPGEFFFNETTCTLYLVVNGTSSPPTEGLVATSVKDLMQIIGGSPERPVKGLHVKGITFVDSAHTYLDAHGIPSGGDWALQRKAALFLENTTECIISQCLFKNLDGNALMLSGYNRFTEIRENEFVFIGDTAMAAWGFTDNEYGTNGLQPRYTQVVQNVVHEIGIFTKQASCWFQAKTSQSLLEGNICFNGPRAGINFNDGFGGGSRLTRNLVFNTCRQSGDHGPFNSWDRLPFITEVNPDAGPNGSFVPAMNEIDHNFMIGNYESQEAIDNDDGSCYYSTHDNVFLYSGNGMKNDFGGHDNHHFNNLYAYSSNECLSIVAQLPGHIDFFFNNTCVLTNADPSIGSFDCDAAPDAAPFMEGLDLYTRDGNITVCSEPLKEYMASGKLPYSSVGAWPSDEYLIDLATAILLENM